LVRRIHGVGWVHRRPCSSRMTGRTKGKKPSMRHPLTLKAALSALVLATPLSAQVSQPTPFTAAGLRLEVDRREVKVGESLTLTMEFAQHSFGAQAEPVEPQIHTPVNFEIGMKFSSTRIEMVDQATRVITTTKYKLTATQVGEEKFGPYSLIFTDAQGMKREVESNIATVKVVEKGSLFSSSKKKEATPKAAAQVAPGPQDEMKDLKPLLPESHWVLWTLFWIALLGAIGGFAYRIWSRRRVKPQAAPAPLEEGTRLREIWKKLGKEDLGSAEFCRMLSSLVRECLRARYGIDAPDLTTEEILTDLKGVRLFKDDLEAAEKCLRACDRVLYAEGNLTGRDALRSAAQNLLPKSPKA